MQGGLGTVHALYDCRARIMLTRARVRALSVRITYILPIDSVDIICSVCVCVCVCVLVLARPYGSCNICTYR